MHEWKMLRKSRYAIKQSRSAQFLYKNLCFYLSRNHQSESITCGGPRGGITIDSLYRVHVVGKPGRLRVSPDCQWEAAGPAAADRPALPLLHSTMQPVIRKLDHVWMQFRLLSEAKQTNMVCCWMNTILIVTSVHIFRVLLLLYILYCLWEFYALTIWLFTLCSVL